MCAPAIYRSIQLYATCAARSRTPSPPSHCVLLPVHHTVHIHACVRPCIVRVAMAHDAVQVLRHSSHRRLKCVRAQNNSQTALAGLAFHRAAPNRQHTHRTFPLEGCVGGAEPTCTLCGNQINCDREFCRQSRSQRRSASHVQ